MLLIFLTINNTIRQEFKYPFFFYFIKLRLIKFYTYYSDSHEL